MSSVKRTFTIPADVSTELDESVPNKERSKFISHTLREALRERKKKELLELLETMPRKQNPDDIQSEDVLRGIRSGRADDILANS